VVPWYPLSRKPHGRTGHEHFRADRALRWRNNTTDLVFITAGRAGTTFEELPMAAAKSNGYAARMEPGHNLVFQRPWRMTYDAGLNGCAVSFSATCAALSWPQTGTRALYDGCWKPSVSIHKLDV
jgi:hypothetical protein